MLEQAHEDAVVGAAVVYLLALRIVLSYLSLLHLTSAFVPVTSSSSSVSWPSLQRSGCSTTTIHHGPLSWATASGSPHSSVCLLIWSTTCSMPRVLSNRYSISFPFIFSPLLHIQCQVYPLYGFPHPSPSYPYPLLTFALSLTLLQWQGLPLLLSFPCAVRGYPLQRAHDWRSDQIKGARRRHRPEISEKKKAMTTSRPHRSDTHTHPHTATHV